VVFGGGRLGGGGGEGGGGRGGGGGGGGGCATLGQNSLKSMWCDVTNTRRKKERGRKCLVTPAKIKIREPFLRNIGPMTR